MKIAIASTTAIAALALAVPGLAQASPSVRIENAVARVVVMVEDRPDVAVEVEQGRSDLPALEIRQRGDRIEIDGGLGRRVGGVQVSDRIGSCRSQGSATDQPGVGASVEVRGIGRINVPDAPLIIIRSPRAVDVNASGAVYGAVGRGARKVDLANGGCGNWVVANTDGEMDLKVGGSGSIRAGTSRDLGIAIGGSGSVRAGATETLDVSIGGSGSAWVAAVNGNVDVAIGGSGDVAIQSGRAATFDVSIAGSGDVDFGGTAGNVSASIAGSGDIRVAEATGEVRRSIVGSGDIRIGR